MIFLIDQTPKSGYLWFFLFLFFLGYKSYGCCPGASFGWFDFDGYFNVRPSKLRDAPNDLNFAASFFYYTYIFLFGLKPLDFNSELYPILNQRASYS